MKATGLPIELGTGGRTKWNRTRLGLPKTHALDALCVGESASRWAEAGVKIALNLVTIQAKAKGRGDRKLRQYDSHGFPKRGKNGEYISDPRLKRRWPFATGDIVQYQGKIGRISRARTDGSATIKFSDGTELNFRKRVHKDIKVLQRSWGYELRFIPTKLGITASK